MSERGKNRINEKFSNPYIMLVFLCAMLLPIVYGFNKLYFYWDLSSQGVKTSAEIVRIEEIRSYSSSEANYYPIVRFEDHLDVSHEYKVERIKKFKYKPGDVVSVYYDPREPSRVMIDVEFMSFAIAPLILLLIGGAGLLFLIPLMLEAFRRRS